MSDRPTVSLREIAARAGVSAMSVSRALRNDRKVSRAEAERIRAIATDMGYGLNPFLSTWMRQMRRRRRLHEREVIALISFHSSYLEVPWFLTFKSGTEAFALRSGYRVDLFVLPEYPNAASLFRTLRSRGIRGLILAPLFAAEFPEEAWQHAVVSLSEPHTMQKIELVDTDHYAGMDLSLRKLTAYGYKRIAYWANTLAVDSHQRWEAAYGYHQKDIPHLHRLPVLNPKIGENLPGLAHWVKKHRPDAIICSNNLFHDQVMRENPEILDDVSWVSLNREGYPHLAGIDVHGDKLGEVAARMVTRKIELNEIGPPDFARAVLVQPEWSDGLTLKKTGRRPTTDLISASYQLNSVPNS